MGGHILQVKNLSKHFLQRKGLFPRTTYSLPAVDDVSFSLQHSQTLGLVGESGCGKTTIGKAILKLIPIDQGQILYEDTDITGMSNKQFRPYRNRIQMIFQDLDAALNPKMRVQDIIREAVLVHYPTLTKAELTKRVHELLDLVNLKKNKLVNYPAELSGGEKRRVGVARVLAVKPSLIIADEPTSALDVSIQAQIINLLRDLQSQLNLSYLFISHDLQLVEVMSHRVAVMYMGQIVEIGPVDGISGNPMHPYTAVLWASSEGMSCMENESISINAWDTVDIIQATQAGGCRFAPRCPVYKAKGNPALCTDPATQPQLNDTGNGHRVACHFPLSDKDELASMPNVRISNFS